MGQGQGAALPGCVGSQAGFGGGGPSLLLSREKLRPCWGALVSLMLSGLLSVAPRMPVQIPVLGKPLGQDSLKCVMILTQKKNKNQHLLSNDCMLRPIPGAPLGLIDPWGEEGRCMAIVTPVLQMQK